jgi:plastocyanin
MSVRSSHRAARVALVLAAILGIAMPAAVDAATVTVRIASSLSPKTVTVAPGTTVRWVNEDGDRHRMRSRSGPVEFDSGNLEPGESFSVTFTREGSYPYLDDRNRGDADYHGTIVVATSATGGGGTSSGGGTAPASATIRMANRAFSPSSVTIAAGGSVTFANADDRAHTATGRGFDSGVLAPGARTRQTFPSAGTFSFLCSIHPEMRGTVVVRASTAAGPAAPAPAATPTPTPTPLPSPIAGAPGRTVTIVDFAFEPGEVRVPVGATVAWQNAGTAPHTVTAGDGSFDSGTIAAGASFSRTFDAPGSFAFACQFHPEMTGTVVVGVDASASPAASTPRPTASPSASVATTAAGLGSDGRPPAAPDLEPAAVRDSVVRLLVVSAMVAAAVAVFGVLVAGTARTRRRR